MKQGDYQLIVSANRASFAGASRSLVLSRARRAALQTLQITRQDEFSAACRLFSPKKAGDYATRWVDILVRPSQALGTATRRWFDILYLRRQVERNIDRGLSSDLSQELGTARTLVRFDLRRLLRYSVFFPRSINQRVQYNMTARTELKLQRYNDVYLRILN